MDYPYLIIPITVLITSNILKLVIAGIKGNLTLKNIFITYGGMPSSHTSFAVSITTLIGLRLGFDTPIFAACLVFTLLIIRDAVNFRNILGKIGQVFNRLVEQLPAAERQAAPVLPERTGHNLIEVSVGAIWGIGITYFLNLFWTQLHHIIQTLP